jgi:hypothetical protein
LKRGLWTRFRARVSKIADPYDDDIPSYREMALDNAEEALRISGELDDDGPYPDPPVAGIDYDEREIPPEMAVRVEARMEEVYVYVQRVKARLAARRAAKRRRVGVVAATGALLLGSAGAAGGALGLKPSFVDDLFALIDRSDHGSNKSDRPGRMPPPHAALNRSPGPNAMGPPVEVPWSDGGPGSSAVTYVTGQGDVCIALASTSLARGITGADWSCSAPGALRSQLRKRPAILHGIQTTKNITVKGFARPAVHHVQVLGPAGRMRVRLTEPWTPRGPNVPRLRVFVAVGPLPNNDDLPSVALDPRKYHVIADR